MQQLLTVRTGRMVLSAFVATLVVTAGLAGVVGVAVGAPAADTSRTLDGCGPIDESGTYTLTRNITEAPASGCFSVQADGVTIDGNGHTVVGNGSGVAVTAMGADEVTVSNITLTNWATGVAVTAGTARPTVRNVTVTNGSVGVAVFDGAVAATVTDSRFRNLTSVAIELQADDSRVVGNDFAATGGAAVSLTRSDDSIVADNEIRATGGGVMVTNAAGVTVKENSLDNVNGTSIRVAGEGETWWESHAFDVPLYIAVRLSPSTPRGPNEIVNNTVVDGNGNGILVDDAGDVMVTENRVVRSRDGIRVTNTSGVVIMGNSALDNRDDGISLGNAPRGVVRNNTLRNNTDDGVYVIGNNTTVTANVATGNGDDGVDVQNSIGVSVRKNDFSNNGDDGVFFRTVADALVEANTIRGNGDDGVDLRGTDLVTVVNNTICDSGDDELIAREGATRTTAENNGC